MSSTQQLRAHELLRVHMNSVQDRVEGLLGAVEGVLVPGCFVCDRTSSPCRPTASPGPPMPTSQRTSSVALCDLRLSAQGALYSLGTICTEVLSGALFAHRGYVRVADGLTQRDEQLVLPADALN